jgi:hypothetical protein
MGKNITVGEGHTTRTKTDHRNGKQTQVQEDVEVRPVMDGYHNETVRDKYYFKRPFLTIFKDDLYSLVKYGEMTLREWRVFMYLCSTLDAKNITFTNLDVLAEELGMDRGAVSRTMTKLKARHLVIEQKLAHKRGDGPVPKVFYLPITQLNYNVVYNGQTKNYSALRLDHPPVTMGDGKTLLNPQDEAQRQKVLREHAARESLFPELFEEEVSPDLVVNSETGEVLE